MKRALLSISAVAFCGLAQAVTYSWSNTGGTATSWGGDYNFSSIQISFVADATVSSTFPASGTVALTQMLIARRNGSHPTVPTTVTLSDASGAVVATATSVSVTASNYRTTLANGDYYTRTAYALIFDGAVVDVSSTYTLKAYDADGTQLDFGTSVVRNEANNAWIPSMTITATDVAPVPEPTALALLALGVAGLALRRKAA